VKKSNPSPRERPLGVRSRGRRLGREPGKLAPLIETLKGHRRVVWSARQDPLLALRAGSSLAHGIPLFLQRPSPRHRSQTSHWPGAFNID